MRPIAKAIVGILLWMLSSYAALGQSGTSPSIKTAIIADRLVADFYLPADNRTALPGVIVLGGSRGGLDDRTAWEANALAEHGYAALHLA